MIKNLGVFKDFSDGSIKTVFEVENKGIIEMTLLFNKDNMDVVCVPTHHFCNLGCKMCHLTNKKVKKPMIPIMPDDFYECLIATLTYKDKRRRTDKKNLKISFMGVGEPLLNLSLIEAVYQMENKVKDLGYDEVCYAISTMMPNDNVLKLITMIDKQNIPLKIHFSLHTPIDKERYELIPSTKVSVKDALSYLLRYQKCFQKNKELIKKYCKLRSSSNPIEIHYTLIKGVNDSQKHLNILCNLLKEYEIPIKFIRFNQVNELERSENETLWVDILKTKIPVLKVKTYSPPGREIGSSCGEFTKHYYHEEIETEKELKEFEDWKRLHQIEID